MQTLAAMRTVEHERGRKAELSLVRTAKRRALLLGPRPGDCATTWLRVGRVLSTVAQVATKAVAVGPQALAVRRRGSRPPASAPPYGSAFLHRGSATAATSPHVSPRHTRSRTRVPHGIV